MAANIGKGSVLLVLGVLGAMFGAIYYYTRPRADSTSGEGRWDIGNTLTIVREDYLITDKKWRPDEYLFPGDEQIYAPQWWYKLDNGAWYPEGWLKEATEA